MRLLPILNLVFCTLAAPAFCKEVASQPWKIYEKWPFSAQEAKQRQQETATVLNIPVKKTITIGKDAKGQPVARLSSRDLVESSGFLVD